MKSKKNFIEYRTWLLAIMLLLLGAGALNPLTAQQESAELDPLERIDNALSHAAERDRISGVVLIARDGEILFEKAYGHAIEEWQTPNTTDSVFLIGDLTMQFTAMSILMLHERGLLSIDDPICSYLSECPESWQQITIAHVLNHTSGIQEFSSELSSTRPIRPQEIIEQVQEKDLFRDEVGSSYLYSGSDYIILGYIIEQVSGDSYEIFLRQNILTPLGLQSTGCAHNSRIVPYMAQGYSGRLRAPYVNMGYIFSAYGMYSTVEDLYRWAQALFGEGLVSPETWDTAMQNAYVYEDENADDSWKYAAGLWFGTVAHQAVVGHSGWIKGYTSDFSYYPADGTTVIVLLNNDNNNAYIYGNMIARVLYDD